MATYKDEKIVNKVVDIIATLGLETPALFFLETYKPLSNVFSQFLAFASAPFLLLLGYEEDAYDYFEILGKQETIEKVIQKIKASTEKIDEQQRKEKEGRVKSLFSRIFRCK
jgi:hypothetical protein